MFSEYSCMKYLNMPEHPLLMHVDLQQNTQIFGFQYFIFWYLICFVDHAYYLEIFLKALRNLVFY